MELEQPPVPEPEVPAGRLPAFLAGLALPTSREEALAYAEAHGAGEEALSFLEGLPAAVFESPAGLTHALSGLDPQHLPREPESDPTEDGLSS